MKVLDLQCRQGHVFEGWFASEDDFRQQLQRRLVQCPLCADEQISKRLSAPRLNLGARAPAPAQQAAAAADQARPETANLPASTGAQPPPAALQAAWLELARKIAAHTEDVGRRFAREARQMHHGQLPERPIRGQATPDEAQQLLEEGIAIMPLPLPAIAKETLQ